MSKHIFTDVLRCPKTKMRVLRVADRIVSYKGMSQLNKISKKLLPFASYMTATTSLTHNLDEIPVHGVAIIQSLDLFHLLRIILVKALETRVKVLTPNCPSSQRLPVKLRDIRRQHSEFQFKALDFPGPACQN